MDGRHFLLLSRGLSRRIICQIPPSLPFQPSASIMFHRWVTALLQGRGLEGEPPPIPELNGKTLIFLTNTVGTRPKMTLVSFYFSSAKNCIIVNEFWAVKWWECHIFSPDLVIVGCWLWAFSFEREVGIYVQVISCSSNTCCLSSGHYVQAPPLHQPALLQPMCVRGSQLLPATWASPAGTLLTRTPSL